MTTDRMARFVVFSQREEVAFPESELVHRAEKFFATKVGLREPAKRDEAAGELHGTFVVLEKGRSSRLVDLVIRSRSESDGALVAANAAANSNGLKLLSDRCPAVYEVHGEDPRATLLIAAILASVALGPAVSLEDGEVFGVKTAREKLENLASN